MTPTGHGSSTAVADQESHRGAKAPLEITADIGQPEWDAFLASHRGTVEHLWAWRHIFNDVFGHDCAFLAARRAGAVVGVLPLAFVKSLIFGRSVVSLPFANYAGVVTQDAEAAAALAASARDLAREFGADCVELRNIDRHLPSLPCRMHKVGSRLALPPTSDELFKSIDRKVRNQIRKAQKDGVVVEQGDAALL
jgi:hypothetical protein